ncbi:hypothetical protein [Streptomyces sp. MP131-18]|uniref:hypothetical protein n=1 Tax=Streptomyces sp. MP131-18 TaxID=1857892 RepID=UPI0009D20785|nr:hypothetical protein [Streptomyces sp. MP131-18]ONK14701.1 hypothetical protein STBA_54900 [Streptomyces sp. MP131-18]
MNAQQDHGDRREWADPRYADMVERVYAERRRSKQRSGPRPMRAFMYELPPDRRPPTSD